MLQINAGKPGARSERGSSPDPAGRAFKKGGKGGFAAGPDPRSPAPGSPAAGADGADFAGKASPPPAAPRRIGSPRGAASSSGRCQTAGVGGDAAGAAPALLSRGGSPVPGTASGGGSGGGGRRLRGEARRGARRVSFRFFPAIRRVLPLIARWRERGEATRPGTRGAHGGPGARLPAGCSSPAYNRDAPVLLPSHRPPQKPPQNRGLKTNELPPGREPPGASRRTGAPAGGCCRPIPLPLRISSLWQPRPTAPGKGLQSPGPPHTHSPAPPPP